MTAKKKSKLKSVEDKADNQVSQRKRSFSDKLADITAPIPQIEIILSIRHLALMLKSGISLSEAVTVLRDQVNNKRLSETYSKVVEDVESGLSLSESMKHFPNVFSSIVIAIVSVGESSGTLEKNLLFLADHLNGEMELKRKVRNALIYPAIVFGVTVLEMIGVLFFILSEHKTPDFSLGMKLNLWHTLDVDFGYTF